MTGSLQIKNGRYYAVLNMKDAEGKRKSKWIATGLTQEGNELRAQKILEKLIKEYEKRKINPYEDVLFSDYLMIWLEQVKIQVDIITWQGYEMTVKRHVLPYFEPLKLTLNEITPAILQEYINKKYKNGRLDGKGGLAATSVKQHMVVIKQTLNEALRKNLIEYNPAELVMMPQKVRFESGYYTSEQINEMYNLLQDEPLLPLIKVTLMYGLRRSELCGLKWDCVDFQKGTVLIRHTVSKCTATVAKDKTKNPSSRRTYPMMPEIREILTDIKSQEEEYRTAFGKEYNSNDYVFKWADGRPYSPDFVSQKFCSLLKKYGLPHIRFHDLRHANVKSRQTILRKDKHVLFILKRTFTPQIITI